MYLIQYSEAAERLGWNVKDCADDNNSVIISRNGVSGRVYNFKLNKENFIADMKRLASQFDADAYAMEYHSTHKSWSERNILGEIVADCYKIRDMLFPLLEAVWKEQKEADSWVCTDPDTCQYRHQVGTTLYEFYDIVDLQNGEFEVVHDTVDPTKMDEKEFDELMIAFDGIVENVPKCSSGYWALIAEAQFESLSSYDDVEVFHSFEAAKEYIRDTIGIESDNLPDAMFDSIRSDVEKRTDDIYGRDNSSSETRLSMIRRMDAFHLGILLEDIRRGNNVYPENNLAWIEWLKGVPKGHVIGKNF